VRITSSHSIGGGAVLSISILRGAGVRLAPLFVEPATLSDVAKSPVKKARNSLKSYALVCSLFTLLGIGAVWNGNKAYGPEMYGDSGMTLPAQSLASGKNYAVFDLNLNIRKLRDEQVARMTETPDLVLLGASHWQEAHADLVPHLKMYNAHIHRDYWEDPLGMVELLVRHDRLPKKMIISIRDNQFVPVASRKDYLWEPGIPNYRAMADRLGIEKEPFYDTLPYQRIKQLLSVSMLFDNFTRWQIADEKPHPTTEKHFKSLDVLLPDGSITWSDEHMRVFTPERTDAESAKFAALKGGKAPEIDPKGLEAFDMLLGYLKDRGVTVYLAHPPFNPQFYDRVQGTPYMAGLHTIEELTQKLASKHGMQVIGGFNPHKLGCTAAMYIDAEHSDGRCLKAVFDEFTTLDRAKGSTS
jgi:hypothetical protein